MRTRHLLTLIAAACLVGSVRAADDAAPAWSCETCPVPLGWSGEADLGLLVVSGDPGWIGRFDGTDRSSAWLDLDADLLWLAADGRRVRLVAHDLGLRDSRLMVDARSAGSYRFVASYREMPTRHALDAATPFEGAGSLALPPTWVRGDTTADLTELASSLHRVAMTSMRRDTRARLALEHGRGWYSEWGVRQGWRSGHDSISGSFMLRSTALPRVVDQASESFDAMLGYDAGAWGAETMLTFSSVDPALASLSWQNPFDGLTPGADLGRMAMAPANDFQQLRISGRWKGEHLRLQGGASFGHATQDVGFVAATTNPNLAVALPRGSLAGQVETRDAFLRGSGAIGPVGLRAELRYDDRDDQTPIDLFPQVVTDTYTSASRYNHPYGYQDRRLRVAGDWRAFGVRFDARVELRGTTRDLETRIASDERSFTLAARGTLLDAIDASVELGRSQREGDAYSGTAADNPLQRFYGFADRNRNHWAVDLHGMAGESVTFGARFERSMETYPATLIGVTDRRDTGVEFDVGWELAEDMQLGAFVMRQTAATGQAGSGAFATPDWWADSEDITDAAGITFDAPFLGERWALRGEAVLTEATGSVLLDNGSLYGFPDRRSRYLDLDLAATYRLDERSAMLLRYRRSTLAGADWAYDGVAAGTVPNLLGLGQVTPAGDADRFEVVLRYRW